MNDEYRQGYRDGRALHPAIHSELENAKIQLHMYEEGIKEALRVNHKLLTEAREAREAIIYLCERSTKSYANHDCIADWLKETQLANREIKILNEILESE